MNGSEMNCAQIVCPNLPNHVTAKKIAMYSKRKYKKRLQGMDRLGRGLMNPVEFKAALKETPEWQAFHKVKAKGGWGVPRKPMVVYTLLHKLIREEQFLMVEDIQRGF